MRLPCSPMTVWLFGQGLDAGLRLDRAAAHAMNRIHGESVRQLGC
jgi:hypothetical protein